MMFFPVRCEHSHRSNDVCFLFFVTHLFGAQTGSCSRIVGFQFHKMGNEFGFHDREAYTRSRQTPNQIYDKLKLFCPTSPVPPS